MGKKLAKKDVPVKLKTHWDFVLEEMTWLAQVVTIEIKTKKANAKKCAMMVQKHFKDKEMAVTRAEKVGVMMMIMMLLISDDDYD